MSNKCVLKKHIVFSIAHERPKRLLLLLHVTHPQSPTFGDALMIKISGRSYVHGMPRQDVGSHVSLSMDGRIGVAMN